MVRVGLVGIGFMGLIHYLGYQRVRGAKVAAICTRNKKRLAGDWRGIKGNFGPEGSMMDLAGVARYEAFDKLLADPAIDVVDLCLPPGMHAAATVAALRAGKHVFCEKPMALTVSECQKMWTAAEKAGKQLLIGHVLPFFPEYAHAYKLIASGKFGAVLGGSFKRIISDPLWIPDFYDPTKVGGPLLDLHVHDAHFIRLLFGQPKAVLSQGRMRDEVVEFCNTQFHFADPKLTVSAVSGVISQQGRPFTHAFEIYLEQATLLFDFSVIDGKPVLSMPLTVLDAKGKTIRPELGAGDPIDSFAAQLKEVTQSVSKNQPSKILGGELARDAVILCQKQTESVRTGKLVKV